MRRILLIIVVGLAGGAFGLWRALIPPSPLEAVATRFSLRNVTVIEPTVRRASGATLSVRDGRIAMDHGGMEGEAQGYRDLAGTYVLPGIVDMHAHLPPRTPLRLSGYFSFLFLAHGVTSIRDVGDTDGTSVDTTRGGIAAGDFPGPRIFSCGPMVAGGEPIRWANTEIVETPADAERIVAALAEAGHTCVKSYEDLSLEKIAALKEAAAKHGLRMLGHVPTLLAYEDALIPDVQHFFGVPPPESLARDHVLDRAAEWTAVDEERLAEIVAVTLEHDIINTPTLVSTHQLLLLRDYEAALDDPSAGILPRLYAEVAWNPSDGMPIWKGIDQYIERIEDAFEKKRALTGRLFDAGARLHLGSDAQQPFVVPGLSMHQEMGHFVDAGIPLEDVWALATWKAAETLGQPYLGRLHPGAPADFLIFREDPTVDLAALDTLEAVVAQGKLYTRADLDHARAVYQEHFRSALVDVISIPAARFTLRRTILRDY